MYLFTVRINKITSIFEFENQTRLTKVDFPKYYNMDSPSNQADANKNKIHVKHLIYIYCINKGECA